MTADNGRSQEAQKVRQESEFIKRIEDFARYMEPEYINGSNPLRSLTIIAADCLDAEHGRHALAHIMLGNNRVNLCALRSMMEDNDTFAAQMHELCDDDENRSVGDFDGEISLKQKRLTISIWVTVGIAVWSALIILIQVTGLTHLMTSVSNLLLTAWAAWLVSRDIKSLRADIEKLKQQRKRAVGRQKIVSRISQFADFLRQFRNQMEEDAADEDDD